MKKIHPHGHTQHTPEILPSLNQITEILNRVYSVVNLCRIAASEARQEVTAYEGLADMAIPESLLIAEEYAWEAIQITKALRDTQANGEPHSGLAQ